jgi:hypothetical protein
MAATIAQSAQERQTKPRSTNADLSGTENSVIIRIVCLYCAPLATALRYDASGVVRTSGALLFLRCMRASAYIYQIWKASYEALSCWRLQLDMGAFSFRTFRHLGYSLLGTAG